jgi:glycosyltransferase involved in cell wall biosynthesis
MILKVAFLTYGAFPIPATKGGAVENLIESILNKNEDLGKMSFKLYGVYEEEAYEKSKSYKHTDFEFIKVPFFIDFFDKGIYHISKTLLKKENLISYRYILKRLFVMLHYPKLLLKEDFDRVVLVTNSTLFFVMKNKKVREKYKDKTIFYLHNEVRSFFKCEDEASSIRSLIGISEFVNKAFRKVIPDVKKENCYVLKNCVDTDRFGVRNPALEEDLKKKFGIGSDDFVIAFAGRMVKEKGALEVIKSVKKVNRKNVKLLIIGAGFYSSDIVDEYSQMLKSEAEKISEQIIFTGYISYKDMPAVYNIADIAVLPSLWEEPAGMTMLEAVTSGLPLITTNSGGIPEYIPENAAIILERDDDLVDNIAESIKKIMDDCDFRNSMSVAGLELRKEYNIENFYNNFVECVMK